jgi:uncharacterized protein (TIGR02271 family)
MQDTMSMESLQSARGQTVYGADGDKIGSIEELFVDEQTGKPEWVGVGTGMLGTKRVLVPVVGMEPSDDGFRVPYSKGQVKGTPDIDSEEISQETEAQLYSHYGLEYGESRSDTGLPEGGAPTGRAPESATVGEADVVRSEEELNVGKRETARGRARLHKWVESEPVEMDVELKQETARVSRESIDQPVSGAEIGDETIEVELRGEEAMVQKETVAKERIGIEKDVTTQKETVRDEVRKERVEVEGEGAVENR